MTLVIIRNVAVVFLSYLTSIICLSLFFFPFCSPFHLYMIFHPSLCLPSTTSSPTGVNRQWATSKGRFDLDIPFGERENNYSYSSGLSTHKKRMLPKNRKKGSRDRNKRGSEQDRKKERGSRSILQ